MKRAGNARMPRRPTCPLPRRSWPIWCVLEAELVESAESQQASLFKSRLSEHQAELVVRALTDRIAVLLKCSTHGWNRWVDEEVAHVLGLGSSEAYFARRSGIWRCCRRDAT